MKKLTLVNLGGIEKPKDIPMFLFNMFNDKHILPLRQPIRFIAACLITVIRFKETYRILKQSPSPLVKIIKRQTKKLSDKTGINVDYAFTYCKPLVKKKKPPYLVMQNFYSHTTHGKVVETGKTKPPICIYHGFIDLFIKRIKEALYTMPNAAILLSAHSIPTKTAIETRDPYPHDLEVFRKTLEKLLKKQVYLSFQSKLGPIEWLKPSTSEKIKQLSKEHNALILVPVSFTTDNTETIIEMDKTYLRLAKSCGFKQIKRISCFNDSDDFIDFLATAL